MVSLNDTAPKKRITSLSKFSLAGMRSLRYSSLSFHPNRAKGAFLKRAGMTLREGTADLMSKLTMDLALSWNRNSTKPVRGYWISWPSLSEIQKKRILDSYVLSNYVKWPYSATAPSSKMMMWSSSAVYLSRWRRDSITVLPLLWSSLSRRSTTCPTSSSTSLKGLSKM